MIHECFMQLTLTGYCAFCVDYCSNRSRSLKLSVSCLTGLSLLQARLRGKVDSNGCVAAFLEERLNMGLNFILSAEVRIIDNFLCTPSNRLTLFFVVVPRVLDCCNIVFYCS